MEVFRNDVCLFAVCLLESTINGIFCTMCLLNVFHLWYYLAGKHAKSLLGEHMVFCRFKSYNRTVVLTQKRHVPVLWW